MFQIKPTKPIKLNRSNRTAIGQKTDPNWYASNYYKTDHYRFGNKFEK